MSASVGDIFGEIAGLLGARKCQKCIRLCNRMNTSGPEWCQQNEELIVSTVRRNVDRHKSNLAKIMRFAGAKVSESAIRQALRYSIRMAGKPACYVLVEPGADSDQTCVDISQKVEAAGTYRCVLPSHFSEPDFPHDWFFDEVDLLRKCSAIIYESGNDSHPLVDLAKLAGIERIQEHGPLSNLVPKG